MATKESENFYRLVALLVDIGTEVIRRLFLKYAVTPPTVTSVTQFLVQEKNTIARWVRKNLAILSVDSFPCNITDGANDAFFY